MLHPRILARCLSFLLATGSAGAVLHADSAASTNINLRVMAANLNGNAQTIEPYAIRIFQGLEPDVVAIQEFNYLNNTAADFRLFVDAAFGTNFVYFRESGYAIPNGIISRYPIVASGSWKDTQVSNRGFAWARIDLPGTNDLYAVSIHLLTSSATERATEAANLKSLIEAAFPQGSWIVVAGDMNTGSRSEAAIATLSTFLSDSPIPTDAVTGGNPFTNNSRERPYDYVLPSFNFAERLTNTTFASRSFPNGLVFDSRVYSPLSDVSPVLPADSGNGQHMAVVKDFNVAWVSDSAPASGAPDLLIAPRDQLVPLGARATFPVLAAGDPPLSYQWRSNEVAICDATSTNYIIQAATLADQANYSVVVTNLKGAVTSAPAVLRILSPGQTEVLAGWDVSDVTAFGPSPMAPTTNSPLITVGGLSRGPGLTTIPTAASRAWGANGFGVASASAAVAEGDYISFSIAAVPGSALSLKSISTFNYRRSSTGPTGGLVQAQVGSGEFVDIATVSYSSTLSSGAALGAIDLSAIPSLQHVGGGTNVTFRIVNYGGSAGGTWYIYDVVNNSDPDLAVVGEVTPNNVQETPPTLANVNSPSPGNVAFTLLGPAGSAYVVESATNVAGPWSTLGTNQAGSTWKNPATQPHQFFRARAVSN